MFSPNTWNVLHTPSVYTFYITLGLKLLKQPPSQCHLLLSSNLYLLHCLQLLTSLNYKSEHAIQSLSEILNGSTTPHRVNPNCLVWHKKPTA